MRVTLAHRGVAAAAALSLAGCATTFWWGDRRTTLNLGMSEEQAQQLLGPPQQVMSQELNGMMIETWKYLDRTLTFQNGILQGWGGGPPPAPHD